MIFFNSDSLKVIISHYVNIVSTSKITYLIKIKKWSAVHIISYAFVL